MPCLCDEATARSGGPAAPSLPSEQPYARPLRPLRPQMPMLEWLANNYKKFGCQLEFVTNRSQEGSQFCKGFGGVGGVLRYSVRCWRCAVLCCAAALGGARGLSRGSREGVRPCLSPRPCGWEGLEGCMI